MHPTLQALSDGFTFSGSVAQDVPAFLAHHGHPKTAAHCKAVANESRRLAQKFGADEAKAEIGGWLHDVSVIIPSPQRTQLARDLDIDVLPEEDTFPMIIHQKLSAVFAREMFNVTDASILSAIGCHTTLKANATLLDKIVFIADKIAWDQPGTPPYLADLLPALEQSIDHAAFVYCDYLWQQRDSLRVVHPWLVDAYTELKSIVG